MNKSTSIAERINEHIAGMPPGERSAAHTLIAHYPMPGLKTVAEFSAQAGVSPPTILRFINRLGFQAYPDFQTCLQEELAAQLQSPHHRNTHPRPWVDSACPGLEHTLDNIRETFRHLGMNQLHQVVLALSKAKGGIYLVGGRLTDPIAQYMATHMSLIRPHVFHLSGQESAWGDRLLDMGKRDLLVVFDIRRYQESLLSLATKAKNRGTGVVLLTDPWLSPIARVARHVLAGRVCVPSAWDSLAALFVLAETIIRAMTQVLEQDSALRIAELEALR